MAVNVTLEIRDGFAHFGEEYIGIFMPLERREAGHLRWVRLCCGEPLDDDS
jgi:hypothetical protein